MININLLLDHEIFISYNVNYAHIFYLLNILIILNRYDQLNRTIFCPHGNTGCLFNFKFSHYY